MFSTKEPILEIFDEIELEDHAARVSFYEQNTKFIFALDEAKQYYFTFHYIRSLFELEKFEHVLSEIDPVIEFVFLNEAHFLPLETFEHLLYKKTMSYFQLVKYQEAINLGEQLVGMHPDNCQYQQLIQRIYRAQLNFNSSRIRLIALVLIFLSAFISAIIWGITMKNGEASFIQSFFVIISPCLLAIGLLAGAYIYNNQKSIKMKDNLVKQKQEKSESSIGHIRRKLDSSFFAHSGIPFKRNRHLK